MQSAQVAAAAVAGECPVQVIDSQSASMGQGNLCLTAARRAADGDSLESIVAEVVDRRDRTKLYATLDTLDHIRKSGRIGNARALLGSMLSIKPIIEIKEGVVEEVAKVRTRSKALKELAAKAAEHKIEHLAVLHGNAPDLDELLDLLDPIFPRDEIITGVVGPVIGTHAGPARHRRELPGRALTTQLAVACRLAPGACSVAATTSWSRSRAVGWRRCGSPTTRCCRAASR